MGKNKIKSCEFLDYKYFAICFILYFVLNIVSLHRERTIVVSSN